MSEVAPGTGFANIASGIGSILSGAAPVISGLTGRSAGPQSVTYVTTPQQPNNSGIFLIVGLVIVVVLFIFLIKK